MGEEGGVGVGGEWEDGNSIMEQLGATYLLIATYQLKGLGGWGGWVGVGGKGNMELQSWNS